MTIFQILQVFHASLCPIGHGGYMKVLSREIKNKLFSSILNTQYSILNTQYSILNTQYSQLMLLPFISGFTA
jgi:folate-dependent phosphoribosylglycinamide formyltransferase PurN